jgi:hypothetical protein
LTDTQTQSSPLCPRPMEAPSAARGAPAPSKAEAHANLLQAQSVFAAWAAAGALSLDAVATLRVWPEGGAETESKPLVPLLAALALQR